MGRIAVFSATSALALVLAACSGQDASQGATANPVKAETASALNRNAATPIQSGDSYYRNAATRVAERAGDRPFGTAKNVILFVGDGMGVSTVTAARIHAGQLKGVDGESYRLAMETLPNAAFSKTYSHDMQVSDSASTATALVTGIKSRSRTLGVTQDVAYSNCASAVDKGTDSLFELAERQGLATGIISTARITHATPAATYAEAPNRDWETDADVPGTDGENTCKDIARQFIEWGEGDHFEFAMGGGRRNFRHGDQPDTQFSDQRGRRDDGRDLGAEWAAKSDEHVTVFNRDQFNQIDFSTGVRALGLFDMSHLDYEIEREDTGANGEPSIEEMTRAAITRLSQDEDGYVLMVEGGRIDHGHHATSAVLALGDAVAFDEAIAAALEMTSSDDTLIIVTADHSHTLTIQGYPARNNPILGKVVFPDGTPAPAGDGKPYTTLSYANGSSAFESTFLDGERVDLTDVDTEAPDFQQQVLLPSPSETHAGEDVPVFASGPGSELVAGVMEQNEIFHVMGKATGLVE